MWRLLVLAVLLASASTGAMAINKCKGPDGKVIYQETPCPGAGEELAINAGTATRLGDSWRFLRSVDPMTGAVSCLARSGNAYVPTRRASANVVPIFLMVSSVKQGQMIGVVAPSTEIIHHDLRRTGIKPDASEFVPFATRQSKSGATVADSDSLIGVLGASKSARVRLRFWPWDDLMDSPPISMTGFGRAVKQAVNCAEQM